MRRSEKPICPKGKYSIDVEIAEPRSSEPSQANVDRTRGKTRIGFATKVRTVKEPIELHQPTLEKRTQFIRALSETLRIPFDQVSSLDHLLERVGKNKLETLLEELDTEYPRLGETSAKNGQNAPAKKVDGLFRIPVSDANGITYLEPSTIVRFTANGNYCLVHLNDGKSMVSTKRINKYESLLNQHSFLRIHQTHLINLCEVHRYVHREGGMAIMTDGSEVDVSRRKKAELLQALSWK